VEAGQFRLHVRALPGTRLEDTKLIFSRIEQEIRRVIPPNQIDLILDDFGRPPEAFNLAFGDGATIGTFDREILVSLNKESTIRHLSTSKSCEPDCQGASPS
jgi:hypothetical protein